MGMPAEAIDDNPYQSLINKFMIDSIEETNICKLIPVAKNPALQDEINIADNFYKKLIAVHTLRCFNKSLEEDFFFEENPFDQDIEKIDRFIQLLMQEEKPSKNECRDFWEWADARFGQEPPSFST